jgi:SNF2 family DNA or RNA helicase
MYRDGGVLWCVRREQAKQNMIRQLHRLLHPFMLRRLKADVATSIPPKKETILYVSLTPVRVASSSCRLHVCRANLR